ncbi:Tpo1p [Sugiyamaella lignohabitans]|uniref:Tpo1p n=1 Tax=Sugiyamaella lignohabitans TaxID=796027 RepID=A0A161HX15_9ASCO|nr:Tpo1p [Sugiyamaella lignohabitans]ANB14966.1 Tpo1p [Sugiyamaella lignohabitans]
MEPKSYESTLVGSHEPAELDSSSSSVITNIMGGSPYRDIEKNDNLDDEPTLLVEERLAEQDFITRVLTNGSRHANDYADMDFAEGKKYPPLLNVDRELYRVDFSGPDDPIHPFNWPIYKKVLISASLCFSTFCVTWGSAIYAPSTQQIMSEFNVGLEVAILGVSVFVLGFASGPVVWAPCSELYGRKLPSVLSAFGFVLFIFGASTAKDIQTLIICRFFAGFLGAAPWAVVGGALADMFNPGQRGTAIACFMCVNFTGPVLAPIVGGFIVNSELHWRWTQYITGIMGTLALIADIFIIDESYHPVILSRKARSLREQTGNWAIYAPHDEVSVDLNDMVSRHLTRPLKMLFTEQILFLVSLYTAFLYGILYLFLEAYPIVFKEYGFKGGITNLPYIGVLVGILIGGTCNILIFEPYFTRQLIANGGKPIPQARLPAMMVGGIAFPMGLFWFAWTGSYPDKIHWIVPSLSGVLTGFGLFIIFPPAISYLVDIYLPFAASAMAATTLLRSTFGGIFPLFANPMFNGMGINWAGTLIACVGVLLCPVPFLFYRYGNQIIAKSKFAL